MTWRRRGGGTPAQDGAVAPPGRGRLAVGLMVILLAAGCGPDVGPGGDREADGRSPASEAETATPGGGEAPATASVTQVPVPLDRAWRANAMELRGAGGSPYAIICPPRGSPGAIWGTDVYSDDSSICTAAVHAGAMTLADGGQVVFEIRPGESAYRGSERNGITSMDWGAWNGSFVIVGAAPLTEEQLEAAEGIGDAPSADDLVDMILEDLFDSLYGD
jgi:hypothetical protein